MNPYKNTLQKVKALLKEDDNLTKEQCELFQWQLLVKIPGDYTFTLGKGGVNTIFYTASSEERVVCYPDEILTILENLSKSNYFTYAALDKKKQVLGHSIYVKSAKRIKGAVYIASVNFKGKKVLRLRKDLDLFGKKVWQRIDKTKNT
jgi:hypothetical protein